MTVKRGHMVSEAYIRAWEDDRGTVDVLDIQHGRGFPSSVKNATVASYVYDPAILNQDLERDYWRIENSGIPVIVKLRSGYPLTPDDLNAMVAFLDMHLARGRYADRAKIRVPAVLIMKDGTTEDAELTLGDMLLLSQYHSESPRLSSLGIERWPWRVVEARALATGDGAVMLWRAGADAELTTVSFPLSPTQLLVIGNELPTDLPLNTLLARNCRRWIVGARGTLNYEQAAVIAARGR